jgi:hypothetical protein
MTFDALTVAIILSALLAGCAETTLEDSGTRLADVVVRGAKRLRKSDAAELVVRYEPMHGSHQHYVVDIYHSAPGNEPYSNQIRVRCETGGYTGWHTRYVHVPRDLHVAKFNQPTEVTLRKAGERIDVVGVR